jgi:hypothetical protein
MQHDTLCNNVLGYIELEKPGSAIVEGWCFHTEKFILPIRVTSNGIPIEVTIVERQDVSNYYKNDNIGQCGWSFTGNPNSKFKLEMNIDNTWTTVFSRAGVNATINPTTPTFIVVDNFYSDPDSVREFALSKRMSLHPKQHKGARTDSVYRFDGLKEKFEGLIGRRIKNWDKYGTNGSFQLNIAGDQSVYHTDVQEYAGVLFLTPDAHHKLEQAFIALSLQSSRRYVIIMRLCL